MDMRTRHIISVLPDSHKLVQKELTESPGYKEFHQLVVQEDDNDDEVKTAIAIRDQVIQLPIRVGQTVSVVSTPEQALQELISICFLQRRFNETIKIFAVRPSGRHFIPYITNLRENEDDKRENMVNYNYPASSCGGCTSCG
jgi:hypothetical protein